MSKRILVMSDLHCGHVVGLTPPRWQIKPSDTKGRTKRTKYAETASEAWEWYLRNIRRCGPYDMVVVNGDAIDGHGQASGGTELITSDREEQSEMAVYAIQRAMGKKNGRKCRLVMTYGTAYHSGKEEDWESIIASDLNAEKIGAHEWIDVGGWVFDFKHHVGSSVIPHGRYTAVARDALWSSLWAERGDAPKSDVIIRSHVHYFGYCSDGRVLMMTTPALQAMGSKFGSRRCSGVVDFGFVVFDIDKGAMAWHDERANLQSQKSSALRV